MNIRTLIALSLLPTGLTACGGTANYPECDSESREFDVTDAEVLASHVFDTYTYQSGTPAADVDCSLVCRNTVYDDAFPESDSSECVMDLDADALAAAEGADTADTGAGQTVVGTISCSGTQFEYYCEGRRPLGHVELAALGGGLALGPYLAQAAHFETAAVTAFDQLALQLVALGAPKSLVARCRAARQDEVRHASTVGALARGLGCTPPPAVVEAVPETLLAVAMNNATEGCVAETWAALQAHLVAARATRADLRRAYAQIAADETRHAQLAWDLHAWLCDQLSPAERAVVARAQREAVVKLAGSARARLESLPTEFGLSDLCGADRLIERFTAGLAA